MDDIAIIPQKCFECGDPVPSTDATPRCAGGCPNPVRSCDACGGNFKPTAPPDDQPLYELHGCKDGKVRAKLDNPTCLHCGAAKAGVGAVCGCPGDTAKRKADDDTLAAKWALDRQHTQARVKTEQARVKAARHLVDRKRAVPEQPTGGSRYRTSILQDEILNPVDRTRDRQDAELVDRERTVKDRELSRRERRQDGYDAQDTAATEKATETEPDPELNFADFGQDVTLLGIDRMPSAFVRDDGETLLYEGVANTIYGEPSSAKSWIALMAVIQQLRAGRRVIWWDNEDRATTLAKRLQLLRATDLIGIETLAFRTGDMHLSETAMAEALEFLGGGSGPGLVVIDSATAFGCPKDASRRSTLG